MVEKGKGKAEIFTRLLTAPLLLLIGFVALLFFAASYPFVLAYGQWLKFRFWRRHGKHGRFVLFVYSDSPNWKDYIEANIIPRLKSHVLILNWSQRREWERLNPLEARVFSHWAGEEEFNPMALVFSPGGRVRDVRFWRAFRDFKHGKEQSLKEAEHLLFTEVERIASKLA